MQYKNLVWMLNELQLTGKSDFNRSEIEKYLNIIENLEDLGMEVGGMCES